jgi:hypothetical protein
MSTNIFFLASAALLGEHHGAPWPVSSGRACRACGSIIEVRDGFGLSEGVCPVCRGDQGVELIGRPLAVRAVVALGERASRSIAAIRRAA